MRSRTTIKNPNTARTLNLTVKLEPLCPMVEDPNISAAQEYEPPAHPVQEMVNMKLRRRHAHVRCNQGRALRETGSHCGRPTEGSDWRLRQHEQRGRANLCP